LNHEKWMPPSFSACPETPKNDIFFRIPNFFRPTRPKVRPRGRCSHGADRFQRKMLKVNVSRSVIWRYHHQCINPRCRTCLKTHPWVMLHTTDYLGFKKFQILTDIWASQYRPQPPARESGNIGFWGPPTRLMGKSGVAAHAMATSWNFICSGHILRLAVNPAALACGLWERRGVRGYPPGGLVWVGWSDQVEGQKKTIFWFFMFPDPNNRGVHVGGRSGSRV
jgi:hypothetical protein